MSLSLSLSLYLSLSIFFGHVMSSHNSEQMSQRSQVSRIALKRCSQNVFVFVNLVMSCLLITLNFVVGLSFCITITGIARTSVAAVTKCRWKTFWQSIEMIGNADCKGIKLSGKNPKCQTGRNKSTTF